MRNTKNKKIKHQQKGQAIVEYVFIFASFVLALVFVLPKAGTSNATVYTCAANGFGGAQQTCSKSTPIPQVAQQAPQATQAPIDAAPNPNTGPVADVPVDTSENGSESDPKAAAAAQAAANAAAAAAAAAAASAACQSKSGGVTGNAGNNGKSNGNSTNCNQGIGGGVGGGNANKGGTPTPIPTPVPVPVITP